MHEYDDKVLQCFLDHQLQLFPEPVAETIEEAEAFLEECMAVVVNSAEEVYDYFEEEGVDMEEADKDEILEASEVFEIGDGRFLIVEGSNEGLCIIMMHSPCGFLCQKEFLKKGYKAVMVIVAGSNFAGRFFGSVGAVAHGDADPGGLQHGDVVVLIACSHCAGQGNVKVSCQRCHGCAFAGRDRESFQQPLIGKDELHLIPTHGKKLITDSSQNGLPFQTDDQTFAGRFLQSAGDIIGKESRQMDIALIKGQLRRLGLRNDMILIVGVDMNATVLTGTHQISDLLHRKSVLIDDVSCLCLNRQSTVKCHIIQILIGDMERFLHLDDT